MSAKESSGAVEVTAEGKNVKTNVEPTGPDGPSGPKRSMKRPSYCPNQCSVQDCEQTTTMLLCDKIKNKREALCDVHMYSGYNFTCSVCKQPMNAHYWNGNIYPNIFKCRNCLIALQKAEAEELEAESHETYKAHKAKEIQMPILKAD